MRKYSFSTLLLLAFGLSAIAQQTDTLQQAVYLTDSLRQEKSWEVRTPLTEEEIQRREDNRARVERMKQRYRAFHDSEVQAQEQAEQDANESDFLWSDAETGGAQTPSATTTTTKGESDPVNDEEALRMEISRNLQYGKSTNTSPPSPVRPTLPPQNQAIPQNYEQTPATTRINTNTNDLQKDIQEAFRPNKPPASTVDTNENWQAKTGITTTDNTMQAQSYEQLKAGQTYPLTIFFVDQQSNIDQSQLSALNNWLLWLRQHPGMKVEVRAYTHHEINELDAIDLSIQRAKAVTDYWQAQGVKEQQFSCRGYGSLSPLVPVSDPEAKQKNERIEVIILELPTR